MNENEWKILFSDILVVAVLGASISLIISFVQFGAWFFTLGLFLVVLHCIWLSKERLYLLWLVR